MPFSGLIREGAAVLLVLMVPTKYSESYCNLKGFSLRERRSQTMPAIMREEIISAVHIKRQIKQM
jgi:hypothetical protein